MPPQVITVTQEETFTGGLCLVTREPISHYILLAQPAKAREQDTWNAMMEGALAPRKCQLRQATSDEAPGLLAYVAAHLSVQHSPALFHGQHELSKAVSAPLGTTQRVAAKAAAKAEETLQRVQAHVPGCQHAICTSRPWASPKGTPEF